MIKLLCAGAIALAASGLLPQTSAPAHASDFVLQGEGNDRLASVDIVRVKNVLRLTAAQEAYWPPVEAALRSLSRQQARSEPEGFVHRISHRVVSVVLNSAAIERLAVAARPLIVALNDDQKQAARSMAMEMGLGPVVAALN
jgi:hypothetical protein